MTQAIQKETRPEETYEYFVVQCGICEKVSDQILYQKHMEGDETIKYIEENTGMTTNHQYGGLWCKACRSEHELRSE